MDRICSGATTSRSFLPPAPRRFAVSVIDPTTALSRELAPWLGLAAYPAEAMAARVCPLAFCSLQWSNHPESRYPDSPRPQFRSPEKPACRLRPVLSTERPGWPDGLRQTRMIAMKQQPPEEVPSGLVLAPWNAPGITIQPPRFADDVRY